MPFWVKTVLLGHEVHYYMVNIAYFTELNCQICDYAQKQRICRENCKHALDKNFHGHFCSQRKAAKFCHPAAKRDEIFVFLLMLTLMILIIFILLRRSTVLSASPCLLDSPFSLLPFASFGQKGFKSHLRWVLL